MDSFLLTMLLVFAIALGSRDQLLMARLSEKLGQPLALLALGGCIAIISAAVMVFAGSTLAALLPSRAADMMVAFALLAAAVELAWKVREEPIGEPTRSFFAIGIVLLARQLGDGARFVIFALACGANYPIAVGIGGALGGIAALCLGWVLGEELRAKIPLRWIRLGLAACLFAAALVIGLNARFQFL
ncbi:MAG: TMEM165/GDT1 family protein [Erythrobacter sp.]